jgi:outer membrane protein assembly factor BamB
MQNPMNHRLSLILLLAALPPLAVACGGPQEGPSPAAQTAQAILWTREGADWPSFLGPHRDGKSGETGFRFDWSHQPPKRVWSQRIGEGYGIGSLADGRYLHFDRRRDEARLRAFHAETGVLLWEFTYPSRYRDMYGFDGGPRSSPVIDGQRVYVHGVEGMLHCLNATNGQVLWKIDTGGRFGVVQNFFGVGSSPLIHEDLLIVMIGGSPPESRDVPQGRLAEVRPNGSAIVAFDKNHGDIRYQTIDDLASYASPVLAELDGKLAGLAFCRSGLHLFDPASGKAGPFFPWRARKYESVNASTPVVVDSQVLITESYGPGGALLRYRQQQWETVWSDQGGRDPALACHWNTPVAVDGYVYASSGEKRSTASLRCIRLADGQVMWQVPGLSRSSLTYLDGQLICLTEEGRLFHFPPDPAGFRIKGEIPAGHLSLVYPCWAAAVVSHGYLYVRDQSNIHCLDLRNP